jgi:hypothetical protein
MKFDYQNSRWIDTNIWEFSTGLNRNLLKTVNFYGRATVAARYVPIYTYACLTAWLATWRMHRHPV